MSGGRGADGSTRDMSKAAGWLFASANEMGAGFSLASGCSGILLSRTVRGQPPVMLPIAASYRGTLSLIPKGRRPNRSDTVREVQPKAPNVSQLEGCDCQCFDGLSRLAL